MKRFIESKLVVAHFTPTTLDVFGVLNNKSNQPKTVLHLIDSILNRLLLAVVAFLYGKNLKREKTSIEPSQFISLVKSKAV